MPNYQNGKIYIIRSRSSDEVYIGSTAQKYLCVRFAGHIRNYKRYLDEPKKNTTSFKLIERGDAYIELLELFPCDCKEELRKREGEHQRKIKCVNHNIAGRTNKEWRNENKEKMKIYTKKKEKKIKKK